MLSPRSDMLPRGGDVVNQMINERYMQLYDSCIIQHKSKQNMLDNQKGKAFNLDGTCTVSIVYQEEMMLRPKGTGTVQALVMSNYEKRSLVRSPFRLPGLSTLPLPHSPAEDCPCGSRGWDP